MNEACMTANAKRDRAYFKVQLEEILSLNHLYEAEIDFLLRVRRRNKSSGVASSWFEEVSGSDEDVSHARSVLRKTQDDSDRYRSERWGVVEPSDGLEVPLATLAEKVDDLRQDIKCQYVRNDLLKEVRRELIQFKSGQAATNVSAKEFVVANLLSSGSKKVREERSAFLKEMNFPVQRVQRKLDDESFLRRLCGLPDR